MVVRSRLCMDVCNVPLPVDLLKTALSSSSLCLRELYQHSPWQFSAGSFIFVTNVAPSALPPDCWREPSPEYWSVLIRTTFPMGPHSWDWLHAHLHRITLTLFKTHSHSQSLDLPWWSFLSVFLWTVFLLSFGLFIPCDPLLPALIFACFLDCDCLLPAPILACPCLCLCLCPVCSVSPCNKIAANACTDVATEFGINHMLSLFKDSWEKPQCVHQRWDATGRKKSNFLRLQTV